MLDLARIRKENLGGISQAKLGRILGYSTQQMNSFEHGRAAIPEWFPYALGWLAIYGPVNPFEEFDNLRE